MGEKHSATALTGMVGATDSRGRTAVHFAALSGDVELLRTVLKLLPPAEVIEAVNVRDAEGATPLFLATKLGSKHCMRELVKVGGDVKLIDSQRNSAGASSRLGSVFSPPYRSLSRAIPLPSRREGTCLHPEGAHQVYVSALLRRPRHCMLSCVWSTLVLV